MSWSQRFDDPVPLPNGRSAATLRQAGNYVTSLPGKEQHLPHWQTAVELLLLVGNHGGDPMVARIAMMQALNHRKPKPERKRRAKAFKIVRAP